MSNVNMRAMLGAIMAMGIGAGAGPSVGMYATNRSQNPKKYPKRQPEPMVLSPKQIIINGMTNWQSNQLMRAAAKHNGRILDLSVETLMGFAAMQRPVTN